MHNTNLKVVKIEKVVNEKLELAFEKAVTQGSGTRVVQKFHGTSDEAVESIIKDGFRMPAHPGMYGRGIYFATDSTKSAQYSGNSNKLLLCKVHLGKSRVEKRANSDLCKQKVKGEGFDSVFAPRGSAVINDEFIVYDSAQAVVEYIIHYQTGR